jgi:hypothetical protein
MAENIVVEVCFSGRFYLLFYEKCSSINIKNRDWQIAKYQTYIFSE